MDEVKRSFAPIVDERTRLLVLGSLPGEESLARSQYYANPRNHFWRLMENVLETPLVALAYPERLEALLDRQVGLWDMVGSATRRGSLDGNIKDHVPNDVRALAESLPFLRAVAFNGGKSASLGTPLLRDRAELTLLPLPSSSPAYTLAFEEKLARWLRLRDFLGPSSSRRKEGGARGG
ncbi:MAG TPA: DNA-deoxyinosine glycosylase [Allosphingosinicella sp.]|jgi:hypoxanthine-DNA glycosylase